MCLICSGGSSSDAESEHISIISIDVYYEIGIDSVCDLDIQNAIQVAKSGSQTLRNAICPFDVM